MIQCQSCGGTYQETLPDGMLYFHACPPLSAPELAAAVQAGQVKLPIDPTTQLPETVDVALQRRVYHRANARDENVTGEPVKDNGVTPIKSAGAGVATVPDPVLVAPVVVPVAVAERV